MKLSLEAIEYCQATLDTGNARGGCNTTEDIQDASNTEMTSPIL